MASGSLIGLLAIVTLILVAVGAIFQLTKHLRDPKNMAAATTNHRRRQRFEADNRPNT